jgi:preprotein translocase subunit YajC
MEKMMNFKIGFITKHAINISIAILLIVAVFAIFNLNEKNAELATNNDMLNSVVVDKENTIGGLTSNIDELTNTNQILNANIEQFIKANKDLKKENYDLGIKIKELFEKIGELETEIAEKNSVSAQPPYRDFKCYMSYRAITSTTSKQWQLQQQATTNEDGIRCINGIPMVAVGTGWGLSVGDVALVTCDNGNSFMVVVGDIKSDVHTDSENKTTMSNGCRCEFIVDINEIDPYVRIVGSFAVLDKYKGYVVDITKAN